MHYECDLFAVDSEAGHGIELWFVETRNPENAWVLRLNYGKVGGDEAHDIADERLDFLPAEIRSELSRRWKLMQRMHWISTESILMMRAEKAAAPSFLKA